MELKIFNKKKEKGLQEMPPIIEQEIETHFKR